MANAGYSADKKFITESIRESKLHKVTDDEHPIIRDFKNRINELVINDELKPYRYDGKKYYSHTAWGNMYQLLIKMNQIRQKKWFWDRLM